MVLKKLQHSFLLFFLLECSCFTMLCQFLLHRKVNQLRCHYSVASCPTLCDPDWSPPGSSVHGILHARELEWVTCPTPGDLPNPGIKPRSPAVQADSLPAEPPGKPSGVTQNFILEVSRPELYHCSFTLTSITGHACVCVRSLQLCPTLCNPMDCSPPGYSVHRIFRQEYWSGQPFLPLGDLPDPNIEPVSPVSPALQTDSLSRGTGEAITGHDSMPYGIACILDILFFLKKFLLDYN